MKGEKRKELFESENKIDGADEKEACHEMIPSQRHLESEDGEYHKDHQGNHFLNDLQLHQREGSAITGKANPVCRHLQTILEESNAPGEEDDKDKRRGMSEETCLLQFQMSVPRERHEDIRR